MSTSLAIVGGGLAGMAAAVAAVERGLHVELFEQANCLGGRAGSFVDSATGEWIDYCQHVAMGCCTEFLDFCRRTGVEECFERTATLHFMGPDGTRHDFAPSRWLPAPFHLLPGLMNLKYLSIGERWGIVRALWRLARWRISSLPTNLWSVPGEGPEVRAERHGPHPNPLPEGEGTIGDWLRRQGQSERVIERFWSVVLVSALSETVDHASLAAARKVFVEGFLASRGASDLVLPRRPLREIFHDRVGTWLADRGVAVHLGTPVRKIEGQPPYVRAVVLADGTRKGFDFAIVAVPWRNVRSLFAENVLAAMPALTHVEQIEPAAITAVHLWFDRPITALPHAVLVGRLGQWLFSRPCGAGVSPALRDADRTPAPRHYCQVVISGSHRLPEQKHDAIIDEIRRELEALERVGARVGAAVEQRVGAAVELPPQQLLPPRLLHGRVVTQPAAVFSVSPGVDRFRPAQQTPITNLALAGDWTATGWPATMEGAVRSGYRAVEALSPAFSN